MTLPRGPMESVQSWYAGARLGVYILTCICWGTSGRPACHFLVSRCKEKSPPYSMCGFRYLLQEACKLDDCEDLVWWSDGGKHFRSCVPLATMVCQGLSALCSRSSQVCTHQVDINYGVPAHFKNCCDGAQAHAKAALTEMARGEVVSTLEQYVQRAQKLFGEYSEAVGGDRKMPCRYHLFWPAEEKSSFVKTYCRLFAPSSYLEQIGVCQAWSGRLKDIRRRDRPLFETAGDRTLTAINFTARMLSGQKAVKERSCQPKLIDIPVAAPEVAEAAAEVECEVEAEAADAAEVAPGDIVIPVGENDEWMALQLQKDRAGKSSIQQMAAHIF